MSIIHNQINLFWNNPTYDNFKKSFFNKRISTETDAELFLRIGAYLIEEARKFSEIHIPWNESRRYDILKNPIMENIDYSLGAEYLMKGIFLRMGYAINVPKVKGLIHPVKLKGNKGKLSQIDFHLVGYIVQHIAKLIDFTDFDRKQKNEKNEERSRNKGERVGGITSMGIPHPTSKEILAYIQFKRNNSLHRPFIVSEFRGITNQLFNFLEYIAQKGTGSSIKDLAKLVNE